MLDFKQIESTRDTLVNVLTDWLSQTPDGLLGSAPKRGPNAAPSYTCTAIAIQAFNEADRRAIAESLSAKVLDVIASTSAPLPGEYPSTTCNVMCNAWPVISILDCIPSSDANKLWPVLEWLISRSEKGIWYLREGDNSKCPLFSAYALNALAQFMEKTEGSDDAVTKERRQAVDKAIVSGVDGLRSMRAPVGKERDLYLFPADCDDAESTVSFGTTAICAHALEKISRIRKRDDLGKRIQETSREIAKCYVSVSADQDMKLYGAPIRMWDQVYTSTNYLYANFAPIHMVALINRLEVDEADRDVYGMIEKFNAWIIDNANNLNHGTGVSGSPTHTPVTVWSTAKAVISLSRLLKAKDRILRLEELLKRNGRVGTSAASAQSMPIPSQRGKTPIGRAWVDAKNGLGKETIYSLASAVVVGVASYGVGYSAGLAFLPSIVAPCVIMGGSVCWHYYRASKKPANVEPPKSSDEQ